MTDRKTTAEDRRIARARDAVRKAELKRDIRLARAAVRTAVSSNSVSAAADAVASWGALQDELDRLTNPTTDTEDSNG